MPRTELHLGRLLTLLALVGFSMFFWASPLLTPFKLLAVMGHETGHALATLVAGGEVKSVTVRPGESGECLSMTPPGFFRAVLVYSGGYVGACLAAVVLLVLTFRLRLERSLLWVIALWLAFMGVATARDLFTAGFSLCMAALFAIAAKVAPRWLVVSLNLFVAAFQALYAAMDLRDDLWDSAARAHTDAALLAERTAVPSIIWAASWSLLSALVLLVGAWLALRGTVSETREKPS